MAAPISPEDAALAEVYSFRPGPDDATTICFVALPGRDDRRLIVNVPVPRRDGRSIVDTFAECTAAVRKALVAQAGERRS